MTTLRTWLIPQLKPGDVLMVSDLAQLGNSVSDVLHIILPLLKNNIRINISNIGMIDNTDRGYWITKTLLAVARQEKDIRRFQMVQKAKDDKRKIRVVDQEER
ncbi:recombinase family protein [Limosilactobacillus sp. Sa3CUN2]|uniref:Recombinase family protein n=1 Tax=Limosilactobacillus avistercoris TaxID=2762243 RepID=A0ABR8PEG9_9LACO|nr:recombinase family protein [Limosilactobacillus avistercoris]MBD7895658.1 recombinase family protein [Limosilactobacillus avistercoris]